MATIASGRTAFARSGMISGTGLASAVGHPLDHLGGQDARGGQSQEQIGAGNGVGERPCRRLPSIGCLLRKRNSAKGGQGARTQGVRGHCGVRAGRGSAEAGERSIAPVEQPEHSNSLIILDNSNCSR